jgi:transcriptional regulator with XRE-family HTH domain
MQIQTNEARIILAIKAIRSSRKISRRKAAKMYDIPKTTLRARMTGRPPRSNYRPKVQKLTELEEGVIVNHIFDLDSRGFSPRLTNVEDMANYLLETRNTKRVGKCWAQRFVQRRPELKTRFNRVYDFQRALCEDPKLISAWFRLVENMRRKYGVLDCDFYNFNETSFMMGMIMPRMVVTRADRRGRAKGVQLGN